MTVTLNTAPSGVNCPKCGAANCWDNRTTKRNPKAPDFKCRDKSCDGAVWPPKNGTAPVQAAPVSTEKQAFTSGPHIPEIDGPKPAEPAMAAGIAKLSAAFALYDVCQDHVLAVVVPKLDKAGIGSSDVSVAAMSATLFIQASQRGLCQ